ncbi:MAG: hypothetical protein LKE88_12650 [Acidaminococcus provencensis]|jgi:hypothetical protein|uniref:hypothetical protein n=2 Tax=Acidaminococcus TaxID=904 RepID=UPI000427EBC6|nr:hypothetical protein [Acidaminococcus provencensis]MCH4097455.1 hypothetical protein [Acidaminococcus provencensis]
MLIEDVRQGVFFISLTGEMDMMDKVKAEQWLTAKCSGKRIGILLDMSEAIARYPLVDDELRKQYEKLQTLILEIIEAEGKKIGKI